MHIYYYIYVFLFNFPVYLYKVKNKHTHFLHDCTFSRLTRTVSSGQCVEHSDRVANKHGLSKMPTKETRLRLHTCQFAFSFSWPKSSSTCISIVRINTSFIIVLSLSFLTTKDTANASTCLTLSHECFSESISNLNCK